MLCVVYIYIYVICSYNGEDYTEDFMYLLVFLEISRNLIVDTLGSEMVIHVEEYATYSKTRGKKPGPICQ